MKFKLLRVPHKVQEILLLKPEHFGTLSHPSPPNSSCEDSIELSGTILKVSEHEVVVDDGLGAETYQKGNGTFVEGDQGIFKIYNIGNLAYIDCES
jgi:hypothetical protein